MVVRDLRELAAERPLPRADDPTGCTHAVRLGDGGRLVERRAQVGDLGPEVRVEWELLRNDERGDEHDTRAAVGGEPAGEIERVLGLRATEERDDDVAVADRRGAARESLRPPADRR